MSVRLTTLPELNRKAFDILQRELGLPDTLRFFSQLGLGASNYTEERRALFAGLTLDEYRRAVAQEQSGAGDAAAE
ncbi:MAG TPA: hypothetical protein VGF55_24755 [Gemmataceae bacterium]